MPGRAARSPLWKRATAALFAFSAVGCNNARYTIWLGNSPDREQRVIVAEAPAEQQLFIGGKLRARYASIMPNTLVWSADNQHFAVVAQSEQGWLVVHDGKGGSHWGAISELGFAPRGSRFAYAAERNGSWHVVAGGREGPAFSAIMSGSLRSSGDGQTWAYAVEQAHGQHVVVGQSTGPAYDGVGELTITDDGRHVAYAARRGKQAYFVLDGIPGHAYDQVGELLLASQGQLAGVARRGGSWFPVVRRLAASPELGHTASAGVSGLVLSSDEQHLAWKAFSTGSVSIMRDGVLQRTHAAVQSEPLAFRPGSELLAYVAKEKNGSQVPVIDDVAMGQWDEVASQGVAFSEDGRRAGFSARRGGAWHVVVDGKAIAQESWASAPSFSHDGRRQAHVARRGAQMAAVVDSVAFEFDVVVEGTFGFSRDGQHWACVAGARQKRDLFFVVDGRRAAPIDFRELVSSFDGLSARDIYRGHVGDVLRDWSAAEAERATKAPSSAPARRPRGEPAAKASPSLRE